MVFTDESDDELYKLDIPHSLFAKFASGTQKQHIEQDRRDSAIGESLHLDAAGTIFLRRQQSYPATTQQPITNSATETVPETKRDNISFGIWDEAGRKPSHPTSHERATPANDGAKTFLRRRSISTPPPKSADRDDAVIFDPNFRPIAKENLIESLRAGDLSCERDSGTPESPGRLPSPLSEPPASPPLDSEAWVERERIRADFQTIESARNVRMANEDAESERRATECEVKARAVAKRRRLHLADTLQERGIALKQVHHSINSDEWPYTIPSLNRYLRERVRDDVALFYAYMEQELELHQVMLGRLESIEEVGFLSERNLSEEQQYMLDQLEIRQADLTHGEDIWGHYLRQQTDKMKLKLGNTPILDDSHGTALGQISDSSELCCPELVATVEQFPGLENQVKEWQKVKYETIAKSKALEQELHKASTTQLAEPVPEPTVPDTVPQITPGGRLIPVRQPLQAAYIDKWPEKWRKRPPARPLTPPDELFITTTVSVTEAASQEGNQPAPSCNAPQFMIGAESDSTDSSDESSNSSTESEIGPTIISRSMTPIGRRSQARQVLETVVEIPESTEDIELEVEERPKMPPCPRLNASPAMELDDDLSDYHRSLDLSPPKPEPSQLAESHLSPQELIENVAPTPKIWRVPSLTPILDYLSGRRQEPPPASRSHLQAPQFVSPIVPQCPKGFTFTSAPTPMPDCSGRSSPPTQSPSPASRISTAQPGTPVNSPSPALSNGVVDEGPVPSRLVARLETEQSRRDEPQPITVGADGVDEGTFSFLFGRVDV